MLRCHRLSRSTSTCRRTKKAADYTVAKLRLGLFETAWGSTLLVGWTLLGGLDALNRALLQALGGGLVQQLALLAAFALIGGLLDLPLALYRTFGLEQRFGFNRSGLGLWIGDLLKATLVGALIGLPLAALVLWLMARRGRSGGSGHGCFGWALPCC